MNQVKANQFTLLSDAAEQFSAGSTARLFMPSNELNAENRARGKCAVVRENASNEQLGPAEHARQTANESMSSVQQINSRVRQRMVESGIRKGYQPICAASASIQA